MPAATCVQAFSNAMPTLAIGTFDLPLIGYFPRGPRRDGGLAALAKKLGVSTTALKGALDDLRPNQADRGKHAADGEIELGLGHEDVAVYDGGWAEWGNRLDLPVDR